MYKLYRFGFQLFGPVWFKFAAPVWCKYQGYLWDSPTSHSWSCITLSNDNPWILQYDPWQLHTNAYFKYPPTNQLVNQLSLPPTLTPLVIMSLCSWNPTVTFVIWASRWLVARLGTKKLHGIAPFSHLLWHSPLWCGLRNLPTRKTMENENHILRYLKTSSSKRTLIWSNLFLFIKPFLSLGHLNFQHIMLGTHAGSSSANGKPLFPAEASIVTRTP